MRGLTSLDLTSGKLCRRKRGWPGWFLCSWNARPQKGLVRRVQWEADAPTLLKDNDERAWKEHVIQRPHGGLVRRPHSHQALYSSPKKESTGAVVVSLVHLADVVCLVCLVSLVYLVHVVSLVILAHRVCVPLWFEERNKPDQPNKRDQRDKLDQSDKRDKPSASPPPSRLPSPSVQSASRPRPLSLHGLCPQPSALLLERLSDHEQIGILHSG